MDSFQLQYFNLTPSFVTRVSNIKIHIFLQHYNELFSLLRQKKRKPDDCSRSVSVNSDVNSLNLASHKVSQKKDSSNQCNSFNDTTAKYPPTKSYGNAKVKLILPDNQLRLKLQCGFNMLKKQHQKAQVVSPIPDFMAKNFPLDFPKSFTGPVSPVISAQLKTARMEPRNSANTEHCQQKKGDQHENCSPNVDEEGLEEEPVKNSMFWIYRSFPHIA